MTVFDAISALVADGPGPWLTAPPSDMWNLTSDGRAAGSAWDPQWASVCNEIVLPVLDATPINTVAIGAVGLWAHGRLYRPPADGVRIVCHPEEAAGCAAVLPGHVTLRAQQQGWSVHVGGQVNHTVALTIGRGGTTWPVLIGPMALPDEAVDSVFGHWRWTVAEWVLAVEALAHVMSDPCEWMAIAGRVDLDAVLDDIPEVLWTEALRSVPPAAWTPWCVRGADVSRIPGLCDLPALSDQLAEP